MSCNVLDILKVDSVVAENDELRQAQLEQLSAQADTHLGPMGPMAAALLAESDEKLEVFICSCCLESAVLFLSLSIVFELDRMAYYILFFLSFL